MRLPPSPLKTSRALCLAAEQDDGATPLTPEARADLARRLDAAADVALNGGDARLAERLSWLAVGLREAGE